MSSSFFYPLNILVSLFGYSDTAVLWSLLIFSAGLNLYLFKRNKTLKSQLQSQQKISQRQFPVGHHATVEQQKGSAATELNKSSLLELEAELDESIWLADSDQAIDDGAIANTSNAQTVQIPPIVTQVSTVLEKGTSNSDRLENRDNNVWAEKEKISTSHESTQSEQLLQENLMQNLLQSMSGWHKSLVPFLLQNIGWFIGILCFISGSVFFISYTEGFSKSVTIFYTILSYTLLLAWAGYRLRAKVAHASVSGNILMAIGLLLVPLNFSAAARLIINSIGSTQYLVAIASTLISLVTLFYAIKLISGVFNRQLLAYFSPIFFALSTIQLMVPVVHNSQNMVLLLALQTIIMSLLLLALIYYLPALLRQIFVDKKYLLLVTVGSLIYSALVSTIHITLSSPLSISLSYYAPLLMLTSGALFYMDGQLNEYKTRLSLLSYFSFIIYALSFLGIFLSLDSELSRLLTMLLGSIIYARLVWVYRSLVPLYLVVILLCLLHFDLVLSVRGGLATGSQLLISKQWFYFASLPLLGIFSAALFFLRKSEMQRAKHFILTIHLFHFIMLVSGLLGIFSLWHSTTGFFALSNSIAITLSCYYLLNSRQINAAQWLTRNVYAGYVYLLLFLPVILLLLSADAFISIDATLALITFISLSYALNSRFNFFHLSRMGKIDKLLNQEILINTSLLISILLLVLIGFGFSLSIKIAILLFILSLNSLFLSLSLYNRALFYVFMVIVSSSALIFKLYLSSSPSTGLLVISLAFVLFYFIHYLDRNRTDELELLKSDSTHQHSPEKILWFYPVNDFSPELSSIESQEIKNV